VLLAPAQETATGFLAPADQSLVPAGPVRVIARPASSAPLLVDGKRVDSTEPAPGVMTAVVHLAPGGHELEVAGVKLRLFAGSGPPPPGWKPFRAHPPAAACDMCHLAKAGVWGLKRASAASLCFTCHGRPQFPATHTHNTDILAECQGCHDPHGSTAKSHLKLPRERACKQCHA